jgi:hypothetical protein
VAAVTLTALRTEPQRGVSVIVRYAIKLLEPRIAELYAAEKRRQA